MKSKHPILYLIIAITIGLQGFAAPPIEEGKSIFMTRCAACHNVNKVITGPALAGIDTRRSLDWIVKFVHSSQSMVKSGDTAALAVYEKFNKIPMPDHQDLSEQNIKSILEYITAETKNAASDKAPFAKPGKQLVNWQPINSNNYLMMIGYSLVVIGLVAVLFFAVQLKTFERKKSEKNLSA